RIGERRSIGGDVVTFPGARVGRKNDGAIDSRSPHAIEERINVDFAALKTGYGRIEGVTGRFDNGRRVFFEGEGEIGVAAGDCGQSEVGIARATGERSERRHQGCKPHCNGTRNLRPAPRPGRDSMERSAFSERARRFKLSGPRRINSSSSSV